jgi:aspartate racemase
VKKIGIVGGTAWLSTMHYYEQLCSRSEAAFGVTPEFSIESLDLRKALSLIGELDEEASWRGFDAYHREALMRVMRSGAEVALLAANTPHHRFAEITNGIPVHVVSVVDVVAKAVHEGGLDRVLLLGTRLTMASPVIRARFAHAAVTIDVPAEEERAAVIAVIERIQHGELGRAGAQIASIARGRPAILGCTELALAYADVAEKSEFIRDGSRYFNSLAIHVGAALEAASM